MANEIPSNFTLSGTRIGARPSQGAPRRTAKTPDAEFTAPDRAAVNIIPASEVLEGLISRAIAAFKKGVMWDRGTILNLLV